MSFSDSESSLSDSEPRGSQSGLISSVQIANRMALKVVKRQPYTAHDQGKPTESSSRLRKDEHIQLLTEIDEELDYNEELPSLNRDAMAIPKSSLTSHLKSRSREPHLFSPREEGEEDSDDEELGSSEHEVKRSKAFKRPSSRDREEGEASSDDDHRVISSSGDHLKDRQLLASAFSMNEAEYRHRLHERHERRQREHKDMKLSRQKKESFYTRESSSEFVRPRSKPESIVDEDGDRKKSALISPIGNDLDKRKKQRRAESGDQGYRQSSKDTFYDTSDPDRKKSSRKRSSKQDMISSTNPPHPSYSSSFLEYEQSTTITAVPSTAHDLSSHQDVEVPVDRSHSRRPNKSKKTKRDKSDDLSRKHGKRTKPADSMDYAAWESYVYGSAHQTVVSASSRLHSEVIATSPRSSSGSHSSSSTSPMPHSTRPHRDSSNSQALLDEHQSLIYTVHGHHRHKYRRETRESAPPPEAGRIQTSDSDYQLKKVKTEKHKSKHFDSEDFSMPKNIRRSKERRSVDGMSSDEDADALAVSVIKSRSHDGYRPKRSHSKSHVPASRDPHYSSDSSVDESHLSKKSKHGHRSKATSNSPLMKKEEPTSNSLNMSLTASSNGAPDDADSKVAIRSSPDEIKPVKKELRPDRFQQYRLYSSSSSDEDQEDDEADDINEETSQSEKILTGRPTLFDAPNSIDLYEARESQQPRAPSKPYYFPSIQGCRSVEEFVCLNRIEEGTYGVVYRARDKKTNEIVALKRLKMEKERDGFPITSLREINTLMKAQHENIVTVREVVVGSNMDRIYLVMDYVEHDLKSLMEIMNGPFSVGEVKCLLVQLLKAVKHLHDNWILHRDLKTSNLLLSHQGILKVGDFGLAREYGSPLKHYTEVVVTLWYRAPELLLGTKQYTCPIDLWSVGCIFAEFLLQRPLFPGKGEMDELNIIFRDLGTPNERIWPGVMQLPGMKKCTFTEYPYNQLRRRFTEKQISDQGFDLLNSFLTYCPEKRITAEKALNHAYFNERPRAIHPSMFPSWPARSEGGVTGRKNASPRPPAGGGALAAAAAAIAAASSGNTRARYQPPAPPMGGQRFYSSMGPDSRPGTLIDSGEGVTASVDKGFLLRF